MDTSPIADKNLQKRTSVYGVYLNAHKRVLLVKDANSLAWGFPGGGLEPGETHDEALRREFKEETGLQICGSGTYIAQQDDETRQRYFYRIANAEGHLDELGNDDDILEAAYFNTKSLPFDLASGVEKIIKQHVAQQD